MYNANQMVDRLVLTGLTKTEAAQVMAVVDRWSQTNGIEWTVSHLKLIKQTIIGLYGNDADCISPYVKTKNGSLVGPFRAIQKLFQLGQKKALAAMMLYSSYVSDTLTEKQKEKFEKACMAPAYSGGWTPSLSRFTTEVTGVSEEGTPYKRTIDCLRNVRFNVSHSPFGSKKVGHKMAPDYLGKSFDESDQLRSAESFVKTRLYYDLYLELDGFMPGDWEFLSEKVMGFSLPSPPSVDHNAPIGKVSVLQEPGFKARFIANPNRVVQHLLEPLGNYLFDCLRELPTDCTFNQSKASSLLRERLLGGEKAYCFDLSNATDLFPLEIQEEVVMNIARGTEAFDYVICFLRLFRAASRCEWYFDKKRIRWTRGQPLGLYPSFAMFALTHNFILKELCEEHGGSFLVLGDDVVIFGDNLAKAYKHLLNDLGVSINLSKSITSDIVAEFAGNIILKSDMLAPYKWRQTSFESMRDFLVMWGIEGIPLLPRYLRDWAMLLASLPEPVGLGYNPLGISLDIRVMGLLHLYEEKDLPALSEDSVSLADVLRAMPGGSKLSYNTESGISRPVRVPIRRLISILSVEDLRATMKYLVDKGDCTRDRAIEITRDMGFIPDSDVLPLDFDFNARDMAEKLVEQQKIALWSNILSLRLKIFD
jgi:hypothetical protein